MPVQNACQPSQCRRRLDAREPGVVSEVHHGSCRAGRAGKMVWGTSPPALARPEERQRAPGSAGRPPVGWVPSGPAGGPRQPRRQRQRPEVHLAPPGCRNQPPQSLHGPRSPGRILPVPHKPTSRWPVHVPAPMSVEVHARPHSGWCRLPLAGWGIVREWREQVPGSVPGLARLSTGRLLLNPNAGQSVVSQALSECTGCARERNG